MADESPEDSIGSSVTNHSEESASTNHSSDISPATLSNKESSANHSSAANVVNHSSNNAHVSSNQDSASSEDDKSENEKLAVRMKNSSLEEGDSVPPDIGEKKMESTDMQHSQVSMETGDGGLDKCKDEEGLGNLKKDDSGIDVERSPDHGSSPSKEGRASLDESGFTVSNESEGLVADYGGDTGSSDADMESLHSAAEGDKQELKDPAEAGKEAKSAIPKTDADKKDATEGSSKGKKHKKKKDKAVAHDSSSASEQMDTASEGESSAQKKKEKEKKKKATKKKKDKKHTGSYDEELGLGATSNKTKKKRKEKKKKKEKKPKEEEMETASEGEDKSSKQSEKETKKKDDPDAESMPPLVSSSDEEKIESNKGEDDGSAGGSPPPLAYSSDESDDDTGPSWRRHIYNRKRKHIRSSSSSSSSSSGSSSSSSSVSSSSTTTSGPDDPDQMEDAEAGKKESEDEVEEEKEPPKDPWHQLLEVRRREYGSSNNQHQADMFRRRTGSSLHLVRRLELHKKLEAHEGCVNALHFNKSGTLLASGSDDLNIVLWDVNKMKPYIQFESGHRSNVFQCKFMPSSGDTHVVSCARDGQVRLAELSSTGVCKNTKKLAQHRGAAHKLALLQDSSHVFYSCGEDAVTYEIDLRQDKPNKLCTTKENGRKVALYSIHANPFRSHEFCVGARDHYIRIYDKRMLGETEESTPFKKFCPHHLVDSDIKANVTCAVYNFNGSEVLGTYNDEDIYLFDNSHSDGAEFIHRYKGHRNNATVKGVNFYGPESEFVISGSDCGNVFLWDRKTENIVQYFHADEGGVINVLEPHPHAPILATSGLDHDVKMWTPKGKPTELSGLKELMKRNRKEREDERVDEPDMIDGQMLWFLMQHLRRTARRRAQGDGEGGGNHTSSSSSNSDDNSDHDSDGGPEPGQIQCAPS